MADELINGLIQRQVEAAVERLKAENQMMERERCAQKAADWFTLPPKLRTKKKLLAAIRNGG